MRRSRAAMLGAAAAVVTLGIGCARRPNATLEHARAAVKQANQSPEVTSNGAVALHEAQQELDRADRAYRDGKDGVVVDHYAYMTERKLDVARANVEEKRAEEDIAQLDEQQRRMASLHPRQTDRGLVLTVSNVLFETNRAELKPGAMQDLNRLVQFLREHPDRQVTIEGHTDDTGTPQYNRELSQARAEAVRDYLVRNGANRSQIEARGYGESSPVATNATEAGRQQNRRVDVVIAPSSEATAGVGAQAPSSYRSSRPESGVGTRGTTMSGTGDADVGHRAPGSTGDEEEMETEDAD